MGHSQINNKEEKTMISDILMALSIAFGLELFSTHSIYFKRILIIVTCITIITCYYINDYQINFIGEIDFSIWLCYIIGFDSLLVMIIDKYINR